MLIVPLKKHFISFMFCSQTWAAIPDFTQHAHSASLSAVAVNDRYVVSGSRDETIQIYDMKKKVEHGALLQHNGKGVLLLVLVAWDGRDAFV